MKDAALQIRISGANHSISSQKNRQDDLSAQLVHRYC